MSYLDYLPKDIIIYVLWPLLDKATLLSYRIAHYRYRPKKRDFTREMHTSILANGLEEYYWSYLNGKILCECGAEVGSLSFFLSLRLSSQKIYKRRIRSLDLIVNPQKLWRLAARHGHLHLLEFFDEITCGHSRRDKHIWVEGARGDHLSILGYAEKNVPFTQEAISAAARYCSSSALEYFNYRGDLSSIILIIAASRGHISILKRYMSSVLNRPYYSHGSKRYVSLYSLQWDAICHGQLPALKYLHGIHPLENYFACLLAATEHCHFHIVEYLCENSFQYSLNKNNQFRWTLDLARKRGYTSLLTFLENIST